jgi:hypothetical protein
MRRDHLAQVAVGGPVSLADALDRAAEHVAGHARQDDGIAPHRRVQAVLGDEVKQPGCFPDDCVSSSGGEVWRWWPTASGGGAERHVRVVEVVDVA